MSFEKKAIAFILAIGSIVGGVFAFANRYETREDHKISLEDHEKQEALERKLLGAEIAIQLNDMVEKAHHHQKRAKRDRATEDAEEINSLAEAVHFEREVLPQ